MKKLIHKNLTNPITITLGNKKIVVGLNAIAVREPEKKLSKKDFIKALRASASHPSFNNYDVLNDGE